MILEEVYFLGPRTKVRGATSAEPVPLHSLISNYPGVFLSAIPPFNLITHGIGFATSYGSWTICHLNIGSSFPISKIHILDSKYSRIRPSSQERIPPDKPAPPYFSGTYIGNFLFKSRGIRDSESSRKFTGKKPVLARTRTWDLQPKVQGFSHCAVGGRLSNLLIKTKKFLILQR